MDVRKEASGSRPFHEPIQLLNVGEDKKHILNDGELSSLLLREDLKDLKVALLSVAGAYRKGKTSLLNFFLRYMRASGYDDWIGDDDALLQGFPWRGGCERDTTGILIWNEIFKVRTPSGEQIAVIIMDTQGVFDSNSTVKDCATIFALSTLMSSIKVYNLSANIQEDNLQHLQLFTEYGRLASLEGNFEGSPFQKLVFLVRDWCSPAEYAYGSEGGRRLLAKRLEVSEGQQPELRELRQDLQRCFSPIPECFLLPSPGSKVATSPDSNVRNKDIEPDFIKQIQCMVPSLVAPENLVKKKINGSDVTCKELLKYVRAYVRIFGGNELPAPRSIFNATAEVNNLNALYVCTEDYRRSMEKICGGDQKYVPPEDIDAKHYELKDHACERFEKIPKMGGTEFSGKYLAQLRETLDGIHQNYRSQNEAKKKQPHRNLIAECVGSVVAAAAVGVAFSAARAGLAGRI